MRRSRMGCRVDFFVDFEFRSRLLRAAIGAVFNQAVAAMVSAFLRRARAVYGAPLAAGAVMPPPPVAAKS